VTRAEDEIIRVASLMSELEDGVRNELRERVLTHGGASEYNDPRVFESVERLLRRASKRDDPGALLMPELLGDTPPWQLQTHLRFSSHRPAWGPFLIFLKRRILLPMNRWLYEFVLGNFHRQQRLNLVLISCVEELAIENARLRRDLERVKSEP
jgi:hypothetical protein